jgi:predicted NAD/FAD-binding protein
MAPRNRARQGQFAAIIGTFVAGLAGAGLLARALGVATFKAARTVSRDQVVLTRS